MNLVAALLGTANPEALALLTAEGDVAYGQLAESVEAVARFLSDRGAKPGDRVAIVSENSLFAFAAYLGAIRNGQVAVPLAANLAPEALRFIIHATGLRFAFVQAGALSDLEPCLREVPVVVVDRVVAATELAVETFSVVLAAEGPFRTVAEVTSETLAALMFTSGSTSEPRGVMLTHGNILENTQSILLYLKLSSADRVMMVLPYYYSFGASLLHTHLSAGASLVLDRRFMFPDKVLARMRETRCTGFAGVPSHFQVLLRRSKLRTLEFPDLKWIQQAGGKLADHFIEELSAALPQARLFIMYGATEATARLCYLPPGLLHEKLGSVGKPIPGVTVQLLDDTGAEVAPGDVGEIVASGPNIAQGYFEAPLETAETFRNGRLHTGDLARQDAEGFLFIVDRAKDFIKCGGTRTSSKMLEELLLQFPDIVEAAVIGIPDDTLGEAVAAFVVARQAGDDGLAQRLLDFSAQAFPPHLVPRVVKLLQALPKNNAGKVIKRLLRQYL